VGGGNNNALDSAYNDANQNMSPAPAGSPTQSCGSAPAPDTVVSPDKTHWIAIELVDELGKHVPYEEYQITLTDGTIVEGWLDRKGRAKITGIDPGNCRITFQNLDKQTWGPK